VLRRWLRGECPDPVRKMDEALQQVLCLFTAGGPSGTADGGAAVAVFRTGQDVDELIPALRRFLENAPGS
jgi:hypothetical protein